MTIADIKLLLKGADADIRRFESASLKGNYTIWEETGRPGFKADNAYQNRKLTFEVRRYTKIEDDPVCDAIDAALNGCSDIAYTWETSQVAGTEYIRHVFTCSAILTAAPPTPSQENGQQTGQDGVTPNAETDSQGA